MEYKFNSTKAIFKFLRSISLFLIVLLVLWLIKPQLIRKDNLGFALVLLAVFIAPLLVMFLQYYFQDNGTTLKFSRHDNTFQYCKKGICKEYLWSDIKLIENVVPPAFANKDSFPMYPKTIIFIISFILLMATWCLLHLLC